MSFGTPYYYDSPQDSGPSPSFQRLISGINISDESSVPVACREYLYLTCNLANPDFNSFEALQALAQWGESYVSTIVQYWNAYLHVTRGPLNVQAHGAKQQLDQIANTCPLYLGTIQAMYEMELPLMKQNLSQGQAQAHLKQRNPQYSTLVGNKAAIEAELVKIATCRAKLNSIVHTFENYSLRYR